MPFLIFVKVLQTVPVLPNNFSKGADALGIKAMVGHDHTRDGKHLKSAPVHDHGMIVLLFGSLPVCTVHHMLSCRPGDFKEIC